MIFAGVSSGIWFAGVTSGLVVIRLEFSLAIEAKGEILKKINGYESYFVQETFDELGSRKFTAFFLLNCKVFNIREDGRNE